MGQVVAELDDREAEMDAILRRRRILTAAIDRDYAAHHLDYIANQVEWLLLDLSSRETEYVARLGRQHFGLRVDLLAVIDTRSDEPTESAILACHAAWRSLERNSAAARWFLARYRSLLLRRLESMAWDGTGRPGVLPRDIVRVLADWTEGEPDPLTYLASVVPGSIRELLPDRLAASDHGTSHVEADLVSETDRAIWHAASRPSGAGDDPAVVRTLQRLDALSRSALFGALSPEASLELCHRLTEVRFEPGEPVYWAREATDDVYGVTSGEFEELDANGRTTARHGAGDWFGELAFLTQTPRRTTVRAAGPASCLVLSDSDLERVALNHPIVGLRLARALARRLEAMAPVRRQASTRSAQRA
jgi:hypothetical protein